MLTPYDLLHNAIPPDLGDDFDKLLYYMTNTGLRLDGVLQFGSTDISALRMGGGTAASPLATATADKKFITFYTESTATSGDSRGMYLRHYFSGAGGSGEALRAYGTVNNVQAAVGGTVNGGHISLSIEGASGQVSGAGNALRATLELGAAVNPGGTLAVIQADSYIASDATIPAKTAFLRLTNTGSKSLSYAVRTPNVASGGLLAAHVTDSFSHSLRCVTEDGTVFYLMATTTSSNRTGGA